MIGFYNWHWDCLRRGTNWFYKQGRQCTYNVTIRRILATIVAVEKLWVLYNLSARICSLRYPACNAHAPYCHLWPAPLYNISPHYLINGMIFGGGSYWHIKCVFQVSLQLSSETFFILRRIKWDIIKNVNWVSSKVPFIVVRFQWNHEFSRQLFEKYSNIKFHENPSSGSRVVPCGGTDMTHLMITFHNFANAPNQTDHVSSWKWQRVRYVHGASLSTYLTRSRCSSAPLSGDRSALLPHSSCHHLQAQTFSRGHSLH